MSDPRYYNKHSYNHSSASFTSFSCLTWWPRSWFWPWPCRFNRGWRSWSWNWSRNRSFGWFAPISSSSPATATASAPAPASTTASAPAPGGTSVVLLHPNVCSRPRISEFSIIKFSHSIFHVIIVSIINNPKRPFTVTGNFSKTHITSLAHMIL